MILQSFHFVDIQEDVETIDRMIADGEATYNKWRHPDPYIVPWAPGGSKFNRNPVPPAGLKKIHNHSSTKLVCRDNISINPEENKKERKGGREELETYSDEGRANWMMANARSGE
nr:NADH dehydrogenase [ubiquinone] 1 beta subcomplex subunit 9 [Ipomoea batatas]